MKVCSNLTEPDESGCQETARCRELMLAVIERATRDLSFPSERASAIGWFLGIDAEASPLSFLKACEYTDVDPIELVASLRERKLLPDPTSFLKKKGAARGF